MDRPTFTLLNMYGNGKGYQIKARSALPILIQVGKERNTLNYSELMERIGVSRRYVGNMLGSIWVTLYELQTEWEEQGHLVDIPNLTWLVVLKDKGLPGYDDNISQSEFEAECEKIFNFPMWTSVHEAIVENIVLQL